MRSRDVPGFNGPQGAAACTALTSKTQASITIAQDPSFLLDERPHPLSVQRCDAKNEFKD